MLGKKAHMHAWICRINFSLYWVLALISLRLTNLSQHHAQLLSAEVDYARFYSPLKIFHWHLIWLEKIQVSIMLHSYACECELSVLHKLSSSLWVSASTIWTRSQLMPWQPANFVVCLKSSSLIKFATALLPSKAKSHTSSKLSICKFPP